MEFQVGPGSGRSTEQEQSIVLSLCVVCRDLLLYLNHWRREMLVARMLDFSVTSLAMTLAYARFEFSKNGAYRWEKNEKAFDCFFFYV